MHRPWALATMVVVVIVLLVVVYAWIDGGRRAVHAIAVPVSPEAPK